MKNEINICLAWHNLDSTNYGVGALAISQIALILDAAKNLDVNVNFETIGTPSVSGLKIKEIVESRFNVKIKHQAFARPFANRLMRFDFSVFKMFDKYDIVMDIGEGDSFTDIYGMKRFAIFSLTKWLALLSGKKLILSPQTIGPFNNGISKLVASYLMKRCDAVYSRDHKSTSFLKELGIACTEVSDVAFTLPFDPSDNKIENSVGINISGLLWNGGYSGKNQFGLKIDYREFVKIAVDKFRKRGKSVHLVAHVITDHMPVEDDYRVCHEIKDLFAGDSKVIVAPKFETPIEAKSYISQLEFFTGSRMHATIAALSSGVVTVPIAYSRKFSGVFGSLGYNFTLDAYALSTDGLVEKLFDYYDNNFDEMFELMHKARSEALERNRHYSNYLIEVMKNEK
jgi:colanic acid/amylovoran biosynthesis protein